MRSTRFVRVLAVGAALLLIPFGAGCKGSADQAGSLTGSVGNLKGKAKGAAVWKALAKHQNRYLKAWKGAFDEDSPAAGDVLDAFQELAYEITGPTGFWRDKVPNRWFGCKADPSTPVCRALTKAAAQQFPKWDKLQTQISNLSVSKQAKFVKKHHKQLLQYINTYVPRSPSESGMRGTPFFKKHLAKAFAADEGLDGDGDGI